MMRLDGKSALITGAARGIGLQCPDELWAAAWEVCAPFQEALQEEHKRRLDHQVSTLQIVLRH